MTVQFHEAICNGVIAESDMLAIAEQIRRVYKEADCVGSLVVDGRATEHYGPRSECEDG